MLSTCSLNPEVAWSFSPEPSLDPCAHVYGYGLCNELEASKAQESGVGLPQDFISTDHSGLCSPAGQKSYSGVFPLHGNLGTLFGTLKLLVSQC